MRVFTAALATIMPTLAWSQMQAEPGEDAFDPLSLQSAPKGGESAGPVESTQSGLKLESWLQGYSWRDRLLAPGTASPGAQWRLAADFRRDWTLSPAWRASLSDRLEVAHDVGGDYRGRDALNTLREAFVSWRADFRTGQGDVSPNVDGNDDGMQTVFVDFGRINQRLGVASGYNPTDWFREGAVVSSTSQSPGALRQNRLGTVVLRGQWMSAAQAATLAWAPRLSDRDMPEERGFALGLERTNRRQALLGRWAPSLGERFTLDVSALGREGAQPELGLNATALVSDSLVATFEASFARRESVPSVVEALAGASGENRRSQRVAFGGTWTAESGVTVTLERHYASDALSRGDWRAWREAMQSSGAEGAAVRSAYGRVASRLAYRQDLLVRDMWFARVAWDDAFKLKGLNLAAFMRVNAYDGSRSWQTEATWNDQRNWSLGFILGGNAGGGYSEFGNRAQRGYAAVSLTLFL